MFVDLPQNLILFSAGAFTLGWILSMLSNALGARYRARKRDPRDDRIRSLDAEVRIAKSESEKLTEKLSALQKELATAVEGNEKRDGVITKQQLKIDEIKRDLQDSVRKTRELRAELSDRATENVRSEAKLREVETELSVAQASTDLIATGVLDYSVAPDKDGHGPENDDEDFPQVAT
jgi:chaperonin cofactor prefoldin